MNGVSDLKISLPKISNVCAHVEVCQNPYSTVRAGVIKEHVTELLRSYKSAYGNFTLVTFDDQFLTEHVKYVSVCDQEESSHSLTSKKLVDLNDAKLCIHVFHLHEDGPASEEIEEEDLSAATHWLLPSSDFNGMWENLIFDSSIKGDLLSYAETTLLFSDKRVDSNIISWNRVILLHGPPGTGKTSLCKALAQKLCIRLSDRYSYGQLIEINSHSLFSKWFSESGKLVMKMFQKIQEMIDDPEALIFVLIDEVESLTAARKSSMNGSEPSDAIRVVNALLTQIDQIKRYPNVMILTTSNVTGAIDLAFVDRADIKQYIGPPSAVAIFKIYYSCIMELVRAEIIKPAFGILDLRELESMNFIENEATKSSLYLRDIARKSEGLSGRTLRKLPFLAHAVYLQAGSVTLEHFLWALSNAVDRQFEERKNLKEEL